VAYNSAVQLQAHGPHVARHSVFSGPLKYSGKIFKLKFVENRVRLHLSHCVSCTR